MLKSWFYSAFLVPIVAQWFGVDLNRVETLKDKMQRTLEREADFCVKVLHDNPESDYIFHVEFQTTPYFSTYRGLFYRAFFSHTYNLPVRQVVIYIGTDPHQIVTRLEEFGLTYSFELVDFYRRSYREFLYKDTPEEIIAAILCDLEGQDPERIVEQMIDKISTFERHRANKCIVQLQIISNLRNLQPLVIKNIKRMPILIDLSKDPFFAEQFERVETESEARGEARGEIIGLLKTGRFSIEEIVDFTKTSVAFVLDVQAYLAKKEADLKASKGK